MGLQGRGDGSIAEGGFIREEVAMGKVCIMEIHVEEMVDI